MMKKVICLSIMLVIIHSTALSMIFTQKTIKSSHLQSNKRALCKGLQDDIRDAAFLRNRNAPSNLMDEWDKGQIRKAYIRSIYQVARVEAMCNIYANPNLDHNQKQQLLEQLPHIVRE